MQEIEIPPRDKYLHYVNLGKQHNVISWSFSTYKKSICFGLFMEGSSATNQLIDMFEASSNDSSNNLGTNSASGSASNLTATTNGVEGKGWGIPKRRSVRSLNSKSDLRDLGEEMIKSHSQPKGSLDVQAEDSSGSKKSFQLVNATVRTAKKAKPELIEVMPIKNYESHKATVKGEFKVKQSGTYILVFDNTSSWSTTKKVTFHVTTYKENNLKPESPSISGYILKKKRKKMQGWAKRYCQIKDGILSYAKDENSNIRGSLNIAHSVATFDYDTFMLFIDSGANFFRFKFLDEESFKQWEKIILFYLDLDVDDKSQQQAIGLQDLVELPESEIEPNNESNGIKKGENGFVLDASNNVSSPSTILNKRQLSLRKLVLTQPFEHQTENKETQLNELDRMIENLLIELPFLVSQAGSILNKSESTSQDLLKAESSKELRESKIQFFSFRAKKESTNKTITQELQNKSSPSHFASIFEGLNTKLKELEDFKMKSKILIQNEIQQIQQLHQKQQALQNEIHNLRTSNHYDLRSPLQSPGKESVTFRTSVISRRHSRRRSVYSRRQSSIMSSSSLDNNDEFFDAMEGHDLDGEHNGSEENDESEEKIVIVDDSEDDDSTDENETSQLSEQLENGNPGHQAEGLPNVKKVDIEKSPAKKQIITRRHQLPSPVCGEEVSFLSILRKNVGKDLSTVALPISLNEPLNILQRLCEELEYFDLLHKAASLDDSLERMIYVTAFAISPYAASGQRAARKPFNPLLGETYEYVRDDLGLKFISEKVSHNPPIFACYAKTPDFEFWQESQPKSKFWGKSMELIPHGTVHVKLLKTNEHFTFNKAIGWMRNLVGGNKYLEYSGDVLIKNHTTKETCKLQFKESTFFVSSNNEVKATVYSSDGKSRHQLEGQWSHALMWNKGNDQLEVIYRPNPPIPNAASMYNFTKMAIELNEITPDLQDKLPPTDTRLRPDQSLFEHGRVDEAEAEKIRVEELQRARRRYREQNQIQYIPKWFELRDDIGYDGKKQTIWSYKGGYFEARDQGSFPGVESLW